VSAARDAILAAVRSALAGVAGDGPEEAAEAAYRVAGEGDPVGLFAERVAGYRAGVARVHPGGVAAAIAGLVGGRVVVAAGLPAEWIPAGLEVLTEPVTVAQLDGAGAVLTGCVLAIAETGTIVLDGGPGQGVRALTLVPDHHVCVVRAEQIVHTVPEAIRALRAAAIRRAPLTFVSGPSATSDIELERVEGMHGPRRLDVVIAGPAPAAPGA
jgi:L-lactate dehydrogenase complex protein LldG